MEVGCPLLLPQAVQDLEARLLLPHPAGVVLLELPVQVVVRLLELPERLAQLRVLELLHLEVVLLLVELQLDLDCICNLSPVYVAESLLMIRRPASSSLRACSVRMTIQRSRCRTCRRSQGYS